MGRRMLLTNWARIGLRKLFQIAGAKDVYRFTSKKILHANFPLHAPFTFVQVGANDGISNDFLFQFLKERKAKGVAIEPVAEYFRNLRANYAYNQNIWPVQMAVHATEKEVVLFKVKKEYLKQVPAWASGIASLNPQHHLRSGISPDIIEKEVVKADTLMNILSPFSLPKKIDLLQIDVEGYDLEVLKLVDFNQVQPMIIRMEYSNLTEADTREAVRLMKSHSYYCFYEDIDLIGVQLKSIRL